MSETRRRRRQAEEERMLEEERRRRMLRQKRRRQEVMRQRRIAAVTGGVLLLALIIGAAVGLSVRRAHKKEEAAIAKQKEAEAAAKAEEEKNTLHMVAVGDNIIHDAFIKTAKEDNWNFDFLYKNIKEDIKKADLASVNQETPLTEDHKEAAGYPDFSTPAEVADALVKTGFDVVTQATEHAFDQEAAGVLKTAKYWKKEHPDISLLGIHKEEDESSYKIVEKKNFKIAMMNYSTLLSENHTIEDNEAYMLDTYSEKRIKANIKSAKAESDAVIVYLHGGKADSEEPDKKLLGRVDFLVSQGVDVIITSHPHILKGYEKIKRPDGKETLVYYSLGNFVSNQPAVENLVGGMAEFTLKKNAKDGGVTIQDAGLTPLVMHYNFDFSECGVYKLSDYTEELAKDHAVNEEEGAEFNLVALKSAAKAGKELSLSHNFDSDRSDEEDNK